MEPDHKNFEREYDELLQSVLKVIKLFPLYFFVKDTEQDFRYLYSSLLMNNIFERPMENVLGKTDFDLFKDPEAAQKYRLQDETVSKTGRMGHYIEQIVDSKGVERVFDKRKLLLERKNKPPYLVGFAWDVTRLKEVEKELNGYNKRLALACQAGKIYPWVWDFTSGIAELSVVKNGQIHPVSVEHKNFVSQVHPNEQKEYKKITAAFSKGKTDSFRTTFRSAHFTGDYVWYEQIGEVFERDQAGKSIKSIGVLRDITVDKRHEEDVRAKLIAEESARMQSAFIANMSHEIRTPLNAIVGFSNLLAESEDPEEKKSYINIITSSNEYLLQLINDILDISKIDSGNSDLFLSSFPLNDIFRQQQKAFGLRVEKGVEVIFEENGLNYTVFSEKTRFTQVLTNFLSNAAKFTVTGSIRFGYRPVPDGIYVYVTDTGPGINEKMKATVFDRFVKLNAHKQGAGLGLFICKTIIHLLNGTIGVDSEEGKGSTFWFTIPLTHS